MAKPSKKDTITSLRAKIKKLEARKDQELELLKRAPTARDAVYLATFAGLTYGYYTGAVKILPEFLFQFGEKVTKPLTDLYNTMIGENSFLQAQLSQFGITLGKITQEEAKTPAMILEEEDNKIRALQATIDKERKLVMETRKDDPERLKKDLEAINEAQARLNEHKAAWDAFKFKYISAAVLIAMGLAGGTMLFLSETSTSEVANIGAKMLDAVTPFT